MGFSSVFGIFVAVFCFGTAHAQGDVDIAFIVDGSGSVGLTNFRDVFLPLIQEIADDLYAISSTRFRIGFVLFGNRGVVEFDFNAASTSTEIASALAAIEFKSENTNTTGGIQVARQDLFLNEAAGARSTAAKIAILLTDGPVTRDVDILPTEVQASRDAGIQTYVIGVENPGQSPLNRAHLNTIASEPIEDYLTIYEGNGFNNLLDDLEAMADRLVNNINTAGGVEASSPLPNSTQPPTSTMTPSTAAPSTARPETDRPTDTPTDPPTAPPTDRPTAPPTDRPTDRPTAPPTDRPTDRPTAPPTDRPTVRPTDPPTDRPTDRPSTMMETDRPDTTPTRPPRPETTRIMMTTPQQPNVTTTQLPQVSEWACPFEASSGLPESCGVHMQGDFKWIMRAGRTPSRGTGPSGANSGRVYMYVESSSPRRQNEEAMIYIPKRVFDGPQCLSFAAHMHGSDVGSLEVIRMTSSGDEEVLFSQKGETAADEWFSEEISSEISADDAGFVIRGTIGGGNKGDIAIDTVRVTSGAC